MRKLSMVVCSVVSALMLCEATQAAEIYNKDGNKLDFYGRVKARHYISDGSMDGMATEHLHVLVSKAKHKLMRA